MNYCPSCGNRVTPDMKFCSNCGEQLEKVRISGHCAICKAVSPEVCPVTIPFVRVHGEVRLKNTFDRTSINLFVCKRCFLTVPYMTIREEQLSEIGRLERCIDDYTSQFLNGDESVGRLLLDASYRLQMFRSGVLLPNIEQETDVARVIEKHCRYMLGLCARIQSHYACQEAIDDDIRRKLIPEVRKSYYVQPAILEKIARGRLDLHLSRNKYVFINTEFEKAKQASSFEIMIKQGNFPQPVKNVPEVMSMINSGWTLGDDEKIIPEIRRLQVGDLMINRVDSAPLPSPWTEYESSMVREMVIELLSHQKQQT